MNLRAMAAATEWKTADPITRGWHTPTSLSRSAAAPHKKASVTVLVAHATPLVSAGLVSTLRRLPTCDVIVWDATQRQRDGIPHGADVHVVFGDLALINDLHARPSGADTDAAAAHRPKFVLITTGEDAAQRQCAMCSGIDGFLSIGCAEQELFDTVRRLSGGDAAAASLTKPLARERSSVPVRGGLAPGALRRVREHIDQRLAEKIELHELAAIAGLSDCHFARAFKQSIGLPPHRLGRRDRDADTEWVDPVRATSAL